MTILFPPKCEIDKIIDLVTEEMRASKIVPKDLMDRFGEMNTHYRDEYSPVANYLDRDYIFGSEQIYGYGILHRWRAGELEKALKRIEKYTTKSQKQYIHPIQLCVITHFRMIMEDLLTDANDNNDGDDEIVKEAMNESEDSTY